MNVAPRIPRSAESWCMIAAEHVELAASTSSAFFHRDLSHPFILRWPLLTSPLASSTLKSMYREHPKNPTYSHTTLSMIRLHAEFKSKVWFLG